ncbi:MAG: hypothetical protein ACFCU9_08450 [Cyanophyceae cyanobacterium]
MTNLFLKQLLALALTMVLWMGLGSSAASAAPGIPVGSMLLSSCSFIPDYSTQEYRPPNADSDTPSDEQEATEEDSVSEEDPGGTAATDLEEEENDLNFLQRFWQGLFGG